MTQKQSLKLFEERNIRTIWDDTQEKWYFSVVDVIQVLTENDYQTARKYWNKLKERILAEAGQPVTICHQFKLGNSDFSILPIFSILSHSLLSPILPILLSPQHPSHI